MSVRVPLAVASCDFRQSGARLRASLALSLDDQEQLFKSLTLQGVTGFVQLHTCNRLEWWVSAQDVDWATQMLHTAWRRRLTNGDDTVEPRIFRGASAAEHIFRVGIGLESLVQGEREIGGQVRRALQEAREATRSSPALNIVAGVAGRLAAKVRQGSSPTMNTPGMHTLVSEHLGRLLSVNDTVIVAGMGVIGRRCAETLQERGFHVRRFNRTIDELGQYEALDRMTEVLHEVSALVLCSASPDPLIRVGMLEPEGGLHVVDLASPAQVDSALATALGDNYHGLDGFTSSPGVTLEAADEMRYEHLVKGAVKDYLERLAHHRFRGLAQSNQAQLEQVLDADLPELFDRYSEGLGPKARRSLENDLRRLFRRQAWSIRESLVALDQEEEPPPFRLPYPEDEQC